MQGLEKFHHFCFAQEECRVMDHKSLVAMINKDEATLSQWLLYIILCIHLYSMHILHEYCPDLYIVIQNQPCQN